MNRCWPRSDSRMCWVVESRRRWTQCWQPSDDSLGSMITQTGSIANKIRFALLLSSCSFHLLPGSALCDNVASIIEEPLGTLEAPQSCLRTSAKGLPQKAQFAEYIPHISKAKRFRENRASSFRKLLCRSPWADT